MNDEKEATAGPVWDTSIVPSGACRACSNAKNDGGDYWDPMAGECAATCLSKDTPTGGVSICKTC